VKITCIGGGPAGLYFAILMKRVDPSHEILVVERNRPTDTFGFGVVFSDATMEDLGAADPETFQEITRHFYHWDDIDIHYHGQVLRSTGHGFAGMSRFKLLEILQERARELGAELSFETEVESLEAYADSDLILGADGVNSFIRSTYADHFQPTIDLRPNRFVWLGTTKPFPAFTFDFQRNEHGLWRLHAYQFEDPAVTGVRRGEGCISTFIVEATEATFQASGLAEDDEQATIAYCEELFRDRLAGERLVPNRSVWRRFPTISCGQWSRGNTILVGDAVHTAHFSIGSGTRLAMEDTISLRNALVEHEYDVPNAFAAYEADRRPAVESLQRAAQASLQWFEDTERYMDMDPEQFGFNLLTRSLRITHSNLAMRDPAMIRRVDRWFASEAEKQSGEALSLDPPPPPLFTPFRVRELLLPNRVVVSPMCQYTAVDGMPDDWHLVHLGSRAVGGAGLVWTEMTDVSAEGRISPGCTGMYKPEHVEGWRRIVDFVHQHSEAKIGMQLGHAGRKASTKSMWQGDSQPLDEGNWPIVSASPIPYFPHSQIPREMSRSDMETAREDFVRAADMAEEAGFDALEIHFAHGYLLASFISPLTNTRDDEYGGSLENRMRYPLEVFDAVRAVWPDHKPMSVRISAVDWAPGGMEPADSVDVAAMLKAHGCDLIDVSSGQTVAYQQPRYGRQYQTPFADRIRHEVGIATTAVGNISSFMDVNSILAAGRADLCLLARAHLFDPYWTRHAAAALDHPLPWPDQYATLNRYNPRFEWGF
jgi:anthraniloyl-CoA monooxygenase